MCISLSVPIADATAGEALPFVHESAELTHYWKPDDGVYVIRHEHEADASGFEFRELLVQDAQHDSLRLVVIGLALGGLVLAPSLYYLFRVFKSAPADEIRSTLEGSDQETL